MSEVSSVWWCGRTDQRCTVGCSGGACLMDRIEACGGIDHIERVVRAYEAGWTTTADGSLTFGGERKAAFIDTALPPEWMHKRVRIVEEVK